MTTIAMIIQIELRNEIQNVVSCMSLVQFDNPHQTGGLIPR